MIRFDWDPQSVALGYRMAPFQGSVQEKMPSPNGSRLGRDNAQGTPFCSTPKSPACPLRSRSEGAPTTADAPNGARAPLWPEKGRHRGSIRARLSFATGTCGGPPPLKRGHTHSGLVADISRKLR